MENIKEFLKELSELTNKYGIEIGGCGCCGSPFLDETKLNGNYVVDGDSDLRFEGTVVYRGLLDE